LITYEKSGAEHPVVHAFDADGRDAPATIDIPGFAIINVRSATQAADGS